MAAERPPGVTPEVMICESTYGVQSNEPRPARENRFTSKSVVQFQVCLYGHFISFATAKNAFIF